MLQTIISEVTIAYLTEVLQVGPKHTVGTLKAVVEMQKTWQTEWGAPYQHADRSICRFKLTRE